MAERSSKPPAMDSDAGSDLDVFGSHLSDADWLKRVQEAHASEPLGQLGPYELIEEISRGAQGVVFRARQPNTKRDVALKRLVAGSFATPLMRSRFEREIEAVASLNHPNVVTVYGMEMLDGQPCLAMEWIDGQPVSKWAAGDGSGRRAAREILQVFVLICDAVSHAHQRGVIHRDLKPSNILIDEKDQPRVLDFGLAKLTAADDSGQACLTLTKDFIGTPAYASPEQAAGKHGEVDIRTDVYALGVILFQLMTGELPYATNRSITELLLAIQNDEPDRPSSIVSTIDTDIDAIVLKALAKEAGQRYQSIDAFQSDIQRFLIGDAVLAHPPSAFYQFRKLIRRHRMPFAFATTVLLLVVAFGGTTGLLALREASARKSAEILSNFMRQMLASVNPETARGSDQTTLRMILDGAARRIESELTDEPEVQATLWMTIAGTYAAMARFEEAERHIHSALAIRRELFGEEHVDVAECLDLLGEIKQENGHYEEAERLLRDALAIREDLLDPEHPDIARSQEHLGVLMEVVGKPDESASRLRKALEIRRKTLGNEHPDVAESLNRLAQYHMYRRTKRDYEAAEPLLEEALAIQRLLYDEDHPALCVTLQSLADVYSEKEEFDDAERLYLKIIEIRLNTLGPDHPNVALTRDNLATLYQRKGDYAAAEPMFREVLRSRRQTFNDGPHREVGTSLNNLAGLLRRTGAYDEAEALFLEAADVYRKALGDDHFWVSIVLVNLAKVYELRGNCEAVLPVLNECLAIRRAHVPEGHWRIAEVDCRLGACLTALGRYEEAAPLLTEGYPIIAEQRGAQHRITRGVLKEVIQLYEQWGKPDEAARWRDMESPDPSDADSDSSGGE